MSECYCNQTWPHAIGGPHTPYCRSRVNAEGSPDHPAPSPWTPVESGLPEPGERVLCFGRVGPFVAIRKERGWVSIPGGWGGPGVTHWMPLPPGPEPPLPNTAGAIEP